MESKINFFNNLIEKRQKELKKNPFSSNWTTLKHDKTTINLKLLLFFF